MAPSVPVKSDARPMILAGRSTEDQSPPSFRGLGPGPRAVAGGHADSQGVRRHILGNDGARTGGGAVPHTHRGDEERVAAEEHLIAHGGLMLFDAVEVAGNR